MIVGWICIQFGLNRQNSEVLAPSVNNGRMIVGFIKFWLNGISNNPIFASVILIARKIF